MRSEDADRTECIIRITTLVVGGVAAVLAIAAVTVYARKALKQALVVRCCPASFEYPPPPLYLFLHLICRSLLFVLEDFLWRSFCTPLATLRRNPTSVVVK